MRAKIQHPVSPFIYTEMVKNGQLPFEDALKLETLTMIKYSQNDRESVLNFLMYKMLRLVPILKNKTGKPDHWIKLLFKHLSLVRIPDSVIVHWAVDRFRSQP